MRIQLIEKFQYVDVSGNVIDETKLNGASFCFPRDAKQVAVLGEKKNVSKKLPFGSVPNNDYHITHIGDQPTQIWLFSGDSFRWPNARQEQELNGKWFIKL